MEYSIQGAADKLGVSRPTIYSWIKEGKIIRNEDGKVPAMYVENMAKARVAEAAGELMYRQDKALEIGGGEGLGLSPYDYRIIVEEYINKNGPAI